ncbi:hypothetical protein FLONG3_6179 [Fusarium longipes]|uniref:Uncharacterized protein n=1 Tax=Fusarium longipes TaxID=694270 RepID=A0A395SQ24_9HYPO|nr:hypothetical protein FLONG3_6179 [Fusarium longipes]
MSDKIKNPDTASSKSSDASNRPSQAGPSGLSAQNPQPQGNVKPTADGTNTTQTGSVKLGDVPINDIGAVTAPPWDPLTKGRALDPKKPVDPNDPTYIEVSEDEEEKEPKKKTEKR